MEDFVKAKKGDFTLTKRKFKAELLGEKEWKEQRYILEKEDILDMDMPVMEQLEKPIDIHNFKL